MNRLLKGLLKKYEMNFHYSEEEKTFFLSNSNGEVETEHMPAASAKEAEELIIGWFLFAEE